MPEILDELADSIVVLQQGRVIAHDSPEGLRRSCQSSGPLDKVIAKLIHPKTLENLTEDFAESV